MIRTHYLLFFVSIFCLISLIVYPNAALNPDPSGACARPK